MRRFWWSAGAAAFAFVAGCTGGSGGGEVAGEATSGPVASAQPDALAPLHAFEEARRAKANFAHLPTSDRALGEDPYVIRALETPRGAPARFVGILRNRDALVLLNEVLQQYDRLPAPTSPSGLAVGRDGELFVGGERSSTIARYRFDRGSFRPVGVLDVAGVLGIRDLAVGEGAVLHAIDERSSRLVSIPLDRPRERRETPLPAGPFRVACAGRWVVVDSLFEHTLSILEVDGRGLPVPDRTVTIRHDGPIWSLDALARGDELVVVAGGIEDRPLDRSEGGFGNIDSFVFLYRLAAGARAAERVAEINVSALGVVTPKAIVVHGEGDGVSATVAGYGSDKLLRIDWGRELAAKPALTIQTSIPGIASLARSVDGSFVAANPLFDGWLRLDPVTPSRAPSIVPIPEPPDDPLSFEHRRELPPRSVESRLGEALIFTTLMAPWNQSEGSLSRFTCEACHFEGGVDGRIHSTGRGDVRATTKPLLGLFNNRPYFSRALDPDLTTVAHNEFRVAGARSGHDPWFVAPTSELPWVKLLGASEEQFWPDGMRRAVMAFLMDFTHRPNPAVDLTPMFRPPERRGAEVFRDRCARCHAPRTVSDDPRSEVSFDSWQLYVKSEEGPIVWGRSGYEKTGVIPYVHEQGARVPSLRRLHAKRPYFTNGSAKTLSDVLDRARFGAGEAFLHDGAGDASGALTALEAHEKAALLDFLELL